MRPSICIFWYLENYPKCAFKTHSIVELLYFSIFLINSIFTINLSVYIFSKISNLFCFYSKITICNLDLVICNDSEYSPTPLADFWLDARYCIASSFIKIDYLHSLDLVLCYIGSPYLTRFR